MTSDASGSGANTDPEILQTATAGGAEATPKAAAHLERGGSLGRYTIVETLGEGGMGVVYGAYDPDLDRKVALKLLRVGLDGAASQDARTRLLREARAMAKLSHSNVIRVYEVATVGEVDFVAMEFIDGVDLGRWLEDEHPWRSVAQVFLQAGRGLAAAHRVGLVHRDFKPSNVLIERGGRVLVTDFGLARARSSESAAVDSQAGDGQPANAKAAALGLTATGALLGTPAYMAPEQFAGEVDERSDQFSFCVALYYALYRERPFAGDSVEEIRAALRRGQVSAEPRSSGVPSWLRKVLLRGLRVDPDERFASMEALLAQLRRDPARNRRRIAAAGVVSMAIAFAAYGLSGPDGAAIDAAKCGDGEASYADVWDADQRAAVRGRFGAAGVPASASAFISALDAYKDDWKRHYVASCRATRVQNTRTQDEHVLVTQCLLDRRDRVRALLRVLQDGDAAALDNAVLAAQALPSLETCTDLAALRRGLEPPRNPATRRLVERLRKDLLELEALQDAGQYGRALPLALEAVDKSLSIDYQPVRAEALYRLGRLHFFVDQPSEAREALERALLLADANSHDEYRARALVAQFAVEVQFNSDDRIARKLAARARAAVTRWGGDQTLLARIENGLGLLALEDGATDAALAKFQEALAIYQRTGAGELRIAAQRQRIGAMELSKGDTQGARNSFEHNLSLQREHRGDEHPDVARAREALGEVLRMQRHYDDAREQFALARSFWASPRGREALEPFHKALAVRGGRPVRGTVLDSAGKPVAGALVVASEIIIGDALYFYASRGGRAEARAGLVRARTDDQGRFSLSKVLTGTVVLGAELPSIGRAEPLQLDGREAQNDLELQLLPYGTVRGVVSAGKAPWFEIGVSASPVSLSGSGYVVAATVDQKMSYELRVTAGTHMLFAGVGNDIEPVRFVSKSVVVEPNTVTVVDFDLTEAGVQLDIVVAAEKNAPLDKAQVLVFDEQVSMTSASEVRKVFAKAVKRGTSRLGFTKRRRRADGSVEHHMELEFMTPGDKSVCIIPITGEVKDPRFAHRLQGHVEELDIHCRRITVHRAPALQTIRIEVPPMTPLPPLLDRKR